MLQERERVVPPRKAPAPPAEGKEKTEKKEVRFS